MGRVGNLDPHSPRVQGRRETGDCSYVPSPSFDSTSPPPSGGSLAATEPSAPPLRRISAQENNGATEDTLAGKNEGIQVKEEEEEKSSEVDAEIREKSAARKERSKMEELVGGVAEEIREIEWPEFGKVVGTTGVVLAVIAGSSVVLLTVNAILAELSERVFVGKGVQDFFSG
ncbi:Preprotein translocase subunit SECE1 [Platanthera guangdongensis]|uniref:Preprotein translocase subunit SECE1 n=1 Tax=Platanthera guangdongensis TaxID=2320717 RepID=A0ABR2LXJ1_9ASPA